MESVKYIGLDVHQGTISVAVLNAEGKVMMQSVIATKASAVLDLLKGLRGVLHVTFEEGTYSAWLYDVVVRQVARLVVCNPRKKRVEKCVQERGHDGERDGRSVPHLLRNASRQRNAAGHGATDTGAQDGGHCPDSVEERRDVRSRTSEVTSSISAAHHRGVRKRYLTFEGCRAARTGSRVSILGGIDGKVSRATICSLGQPNKAIVPRQTRASDRTMVGHAATVLLVGDQIKDRTNARFIRNAW
jgi:hypothetical protein